VGIRKQVTKLIKRISLRSRAQGLPSLRKRAQIDVSAALQRAVHYVFDAGVEGDFAEFGTRTGFTSSVIAGGVAELDHKSRRNLWLFDSFEGLPPSTSVADIANVHVQKGTWGEGTMRGLTEDQLRRRIRRYLRRDRILIHAGWFSQTMSHVPDGARFALVHVDCDLYQSTVDCLSPLFERKLLSKGAVVIFDDWNCSCADNEVGERRAWRELAARHAVEYEDIGGHSWGGRSFIVHKYADAPSRADRVA
jgi:hypothetical protein